MKCLSCGCTIDDDSVFCSKCGARVGALPAEAADVTEKAVDEAAGIVTDIAGETAEIAAEPVEAAEKAADKLDKKAEKQAKEAEKAAKRAAEKLEKQAEKQAKEAEKLEKNAEKEAEAAAKAIDLKKEEPVADILPEPEISEPDPMVSINEALEALNDAVAGSSAAAAAELTAEAEKAPEAPVILAKKEEPFVEAYKEEPHAIDLPESAPVYEPVPAPEPEIQPVAEAAPVPDTFKPEPVAADAVTGVQEQISSTAADMGQQAPPPPYYGQPEYPQYNAPPQPQPIPAPVRADAPVKVGALRISFAGFIAFLTIVFLIILSLLFCLKIGASGKMLQKRTEKMNISTVLDANLGKRTLSDAIYNEAGFGEASHGEVSKAEFRSYLAQTDLLKYSGKYVREYADYFIEGDTADPSIDANDMADFFVNNDDIAKNVLNCELKTSDYNMIRTRLELKDTANNFSIEKWSKKAHFDLANTNFIFSYVTLGILLGLVAVLLVWIAVIVDGRGKHIVGLYGGIFKWSGAIVFLVGLAAVAGTSIAHIITGWFIFYLLASLLLPFGVFCLCTGAVEWTFGFIMKRIRRGIRNSDKRNRAVEKALTGANV